MADKYKLNLSLQLSPVDRPLSGVGPGVGLEFAKAYFPDAQEVIRIASAYFTLTGYKAAKGFISPNTQIRILVGREEGTNVQSTVVHEIAAEFRQCETDLWETVFELIEQMKQGRFIIKDAREMQTKFHCKFYICDAKWLWHGSANYTGLGLQKSAEQVSVSDNSEQIQQFTFWFDEASARARDLLQELIDKLKSLLQLHEPFDVYLKTLLLMNNLPELKRRPKANIPIYYQKGVIAHAIKQADEFGGALIVAATGLGKTIMGAEIALHLQSLGKIKRVILIAPNGVKENWDEEFESRDIYPKYFNTGVLFRKSSGNSPTTKQLDRQLQQSDDETLIIIDEAHFYRNQLLSEKSKGRKSLVYKRLEPVVAAGAKIFLLTATVYGTNYQNLNSLLYLLPHRSPNLLDAQNPWQAQSAEEFSRLPVVTILGLPHVLKMARDRGDVDTSGRTFIQLFDGRRYLPETIKLYSVRYELCLQKELQSAFEQRCFDQAYKSSNLWFDDNTLSTRKGIIDTVRNTSLESWLSSPVAMADSIEQNLSTLGDRDEMQANENATGTFESSTVVAQHDFWGKPASGRRGRRRRATFLEMKGSGHSTPMHLSLLERKNVLMPLSEKLVSLDVNQDDKFLKLKQILDEHCLLRKSKVIIFVSRHLTAIYLTNALEQIFGKALSVGCTVELSESSTRLKVGQYRSRVLKNFSPHSHDYDADQEYSVLICTDADGVGINLQDADTIVNYDPPEGADVLFQRAGRVLRMTTDSNRIVYFYTLVPSIIGKPCGQSAVCKDIQEIFDRITSRHEKSKSILGSGVISQNSYTEIKLDGQIDVEQLTRDRDFLETIGGLGAESTINHTAVLEQYRERAESLPDCLLSARHYPYSYPRMFVLIEYMKKYVPIIFDLKSNKIENLQEFLILDLIACTEGTLRAVVSPATVEHLANEAVHVWCAAESIPLDDVRKCCALYLVPENEPIDVKSLFK